MKRCDKGDGPYQESPQVSGSRSIGTRRKVKDKVVFSVVEGESNPVRGNNIPKSRGT